VLRSRTHDERGAAAVEFALVSLILITLIALTVQSAALFWGYQAASAAAREAARFGAVEPCDNAAIEARGDQRVDEAAPVPGSTGFTDVTSGAPTSFTGGGSRGTIHGYFTQVIWHGLADESGTVPDLGVRTISLVE
jgi:Flp pilus assembly protein TadG